MRFVWTFLSQLTAWSNSVKTVAVRHVLMLKLYTTPCALLPRPERRRYRPGFRHTCQPTATRDYQASDECQSDKLIRLWP